MLEPHGNGRPRGMTVTPRGGQNPGYRLDALGFSGRGITGGAMALQAIEADSISVARSKYEGARRISPKHPGVNESYTL